MIQPWKWQGVCSLGNLQNLRSTWSDLNQTSGLEDVVVMSVILWQHKAGGESEPWSHSAQQSFRATTRAETIWGNYFLGARPELIISPPLSLIVI